MKKGSKQTPESIERMRQAKLGKKDTPETIENKRRAQLSPETLEKNRSAHTGKKDSPETIAKKRDSHLGEKNGFYGKTHTSETLELMKGPKSDLHKQHLSESKVGIVPANIEILKVSRVGATNSDFQKERAREYNTGLVRSEETVELNRLAHIGLVQSPETREKNRLANSGEKNHAWKGGITPLNASIRNSAKYMAWRDSIYKRDNYTDVTTGERGSGNLNAHHITPLAVILEKNNITTIEAAMACEELWDVSNGITMLEINHSALHAKTHEPE